MALLCSSRKGQAAMEFLMTYGWAILVVLVVIGALAYFGVLSPATLLPEKCTFPVSISCTDQSVKDNEITLILQNGAGRDMWLRGAVVSSDAFVTAGLCGTNTTAITTAVDCTETLPGGGAGVGAGCIGGPTLRNGESKTIKLTVTSPAGTCTFKDTGRDKTRYSAQLYISWLDSKSIVHTLPGEILARKQ